MIIIIIIIIIIIMQHLLHQKGHLSLNLTVMN